jgi:putative nucleotidyltransferase with HDIG domain
MTEILQALPGFRVMKLNPITMRFTDLEMEEAFINDHHQKSIIQVRLSFFLAILLYAFYAVLDYHIAPETKNLMWLIRFGCVLPIGALVLVTSFDKYFYKYREPTFTLAFLLYGLGILAMIAIAPKPVDFSYYASLIVTFIFIYVFTGFRFIHATICALTILALYQYLAVIYLHTPTDILTKNAFFFVSTNIIGMFGSFSLEYYSRRDFYIASIIDDQRKILSDMNHNLQEQVIDQTKEIRLAGDKMDELLAASLAGLSTTVELRDPYTVGHQKRVAKLCEAIAHRLGLDDNTITGLSFAAESHDIGKVAIPLELLSKQDKLYPEEKEFLKKHVNAGYEVLSKIDFPWPIAEIVLQHHEHLDGSGYPNGLTSEEILLESKILIVADVMEAITSRRPYRAELGYKKGLEELHKYRGIWYDEEVVDICTSLYLEGEFH